MPKRDHDFIRQLLMSMESADDWLTVSALHMGSNADSQKEYFHMQLLADQGLVQERGRNGDVYRLTAQGHDYLDSIRDEGVWSKTKAAVAETGGSASIEIMKQLAMAYLRKQIADRTGLDI
ncbi:DUF2513 domain-containing protein [Paracoccus sp. TK19116]|uniref:DUF2513 domain-containing protein n=1 Tax=Paracoccus albicereus TaxID=2922394 RepID=A0ABT1MQU0_9RHOB|nr:DUF2513 domain-containing protein [Paracoccus albicereus]MCQ0970678.1 DUF2513 domain-containing protein [Paracoccus albicereus]